MGSGREATVMTDEEKLLEAMANGVFREGMYARSEAGWRKAQIAAKAALRAYRNHCGPQLEKNHTA